MRIFRLDDYFSGYSLAKTRVSVAEVFVLLLITAVGIVLHFWGLGSAGLHGDEETMAMPVRSIVENGLPLLPSDMFYSRGLSQLYMMAASVIAFGESEWSLRFPSALFGSLLPIVAWLLSRQLLSAPWALMFVAVMTFLPETIEASQTARFYIFYFMIIMLFVWQVHRWGQSLQLRDLMLAALFFLIGLDFQALMIFSLAAFALPMCIDYNPRKFNQGLLGIGLCILAFASHWAFTSAMYEDSTKLINTISDSSPASAHDIGTSFVRYLLPISLLLITAYLAITQTVKHSFAHGISVVALSLAIVFAIVGPVSASFLLLVFGLFLHYRLYGSWQIAGLVVLVVAVCILWQLNNANWDIQAYLRDNTQKMSLWPWIIFLGQFPLASMLFAALIAPIALRFLASEPVPYGVAVFLALVVVPISVISLATWYPPPRYMFGFLPFFILSAFLLLQYWSNEFESRNLGNRRNAVVVIGIVLCVLFIRPFELVRTVNKGCATIANNCLPIPDHRAQAEYMKSLDLEDNIIVIAEDVLQQTYYLGNVDYWLLGKELSAQFVREKQGRYVDIYTGTPTILDGESADAIFGSPTRADLYLIGNPENSYGNRADHLTNGIYESVNRWPHELVYSNENGSAKIWLYPANPEQ